VLEAISFNNPVSLQKVVPRLSRDIEVICAKALEKNPNDRFATAADFAADLRRFAEGDSIQARPPTLLQHTRRFLARRRAQVIALILILAALVVGVRWGTQRASIRVALDIRSTPAGAVDLRQLDVATGEYGDPVSIGMTPLRTKQPPGHYRIVIHAAGVGFAELTRYLDAEHPPVNPVEVEIRRTEDIVEGMIEIAPGNFWAGIGGLAKQWPFAEFSTPGFFIDRYEVTNGEFREFMLATGSTEPAYVLADPSEEMEQFPVVGVTWFEARAYAEWAGKRLPTRLEWDRAARGVDGAMYPWGNEEHDEDRVRGMSCVGHIASSNDVTDWQAAYRQHICRVGTHPGDVSPDGVHDVLGSAVEWTDTIDTQFVDGQIRAVVLNRLAKGSAWWRAPRHSELSSVLQVPAAERFVKPYVGFRCAKSLPAVVGGRVEASSSSSAGVD
jgi:formylglycine-generating enzyme required for sulfatase activity